LEKGETEIIRTLPIEAERIALSKVDINKGSFLSHCLVNRDTGGKDRLEGTLRYGIVSEEFARRFGIPFTPNFSGPLNPRSISLFSRTIKEAIDFGLDIYVLSRFSKGYGDLGVGIVDDIFLILINHEMSTRIVSEENYRNIGEVNRGARVAPRFFTGIVIPSEDYEQDYPESRKNRVLYTHTQTIEDRVKRIVELMLRINRGKPQLCIPIYDTKGSLLWSGKGSK